MRSIFLSILLFITVLCTQKANSQTIELLAGNTLNGAMNGVILGGAAMGLNNSTDFDALRIGLGLGTLYGIGMGGYDVVTTEGGQIVVSGLFNDGSNSSIIVLLDTFYGAATGSVIVTAMLLVANEPIIEGIQYGASIGAIAGFGFGLFDTLVLADRVTSPLAYIPSSSFSQKASGIIGMNFSDKSSLGIINPAILNQPVVSTSGISIQSNPIVELASFRLNF